jgi:hypothetical protein
MRSKIVIENKSEKKKCKRESCWKQVEEQNGIFKIFCCQQKFQREGVDRLLLGQPNIFKLKGLKAARLSLKTKPQYSHLVSKDALGAKVLLPDFFLFFKSIEILEIYRNVVFFKPSIENVSIIRCSSGRTIYTPHFPLLRKIGILPLTPDFQKFDFFKRKMRCESCAP